MLISFIIPTRDRAEVLRYSLAACTRIPDQQIEIIVSDNSSVDDTPEVVANFKDSRIRHVCTPQRYSMRQNFEFAVSHARGDYIFMLGDDDAPIPSQVPYVRALLERYKPDTLTGAAIGYTWPGPEAPNNSGRIKLEYKSIYGGIATASGEQLRRELERDGAYIARWAPRIYGGVASRGIVERLKAKTGLLFMATWPDTYFTFASPSLIERHLVVKHPIFIAGSSTRAHGASLRSWGRDGALKTEHEKVLKEASSDPITDIISPTGSTQLGFLSHLESANRYAYNGTLRIDYEREAERVIRSFDELAHSRRAEAAEAFSKFASELSLSPILCDPKALLSRCSSTVMPPKSSRRKRARVRSYVFIDRVVLDLTAMGRTDVDAAASACDNLLGRGMVQGGLGRVFAWARLLRRALFSGRPQAEAPGKGIPNSATAGEQEAA